MIIVAGIGAVLAFLHLGGRVAHLGPGGLKLPAPEAWLGYRNSLGATLMLSAEQFAGILGSWVTCLALGVALFTLDLGRFGNPRMRSGWREVVETTATILFGFIVAILGLISAILLRDERMMLVEVPMPALALPSVIFGACAMIAGARRLMNTLKTMPSAPIPRASSGKATRDPGNAKPTTAATRPTATAAMAPKAKTSQPPAAPKGQAKGSKSGTGSKGGTPSKVARVTAAQAGKIAGSAPRKPGASGHPGTGTSKGVR